MNNKQSGNNAAPKPAPGDEPINIRAILIRYFSYWPLFAICLVVALAIAFAYTKYDASPSDVMATLMIQDHNAQPNEQKSSLVEFQALEQVNAPKVVENEIEVLRSNQLIKDVVNYFQLWADYKLKGGIIKDQDLYGKSPVKINLIEGSTPVPTQKINLRVSDTNGYLLLGVNGKTTKHRYSDTISNLGCTWTITKTPNLVHYIGDEIQVKATDPEATVLGYQNRLKIESQEKPATVVNISLSDPNVKKAEDFINYLIYFYKQADLAEKGKITKSTLEFIDNRIASLSGQLNSAETNIEGFRSANGLTDINAQSQMYLQGIQSNGEKLNEINTQLNVINKLENYLNDAGNNNSSIPSTVGIADQHLSDLVQKLSDVELERNRMLATTPEKNPSFDPINKQITLLKQEIKDGIAGIKSSLGTMQKSVESYKSNIQSSIKTVPVQEHQLAGMSRQQSTKSSLYDYLLQQREAISLTYASSASAVRLVDAAHILPVKASKRFIPFGIALLMGLIFPAGFIYSRDLIKNSVTSRKVIEQATAVPVIAEFSFIKLPSEIAFANRENPESFPLIEQYRHLRTQINLLNDMSDKGYVVLLTSSVANEGKSMVGSNLAVALASTGKKTLLVEMDIYKPAISKIFGLSQSGGITGYLSGRTTLKELVQPVALYPNLSIIGSGAFVDNFSELLDQDLFGDLVTKLRTVYDYILFDTPPVHAINDAYIIANHCDLTLYVVRFNHTSNSLLPFIHKLNANESLPNMKIVFNGLVNGRDGEGFKYENYYKRPTS
ncbi:GumC family protein [Mucilaginibacter flavidus]|uniref:GumC family protein n=1 Tax=Mucilaginibacter flavidus TaxID=2949309 RepID=UPI002093EF93|nr:polysaccharide biosynthesis tyrosine autokinase [Mucilaginibacter flavidus]MCO5948034.1 polysaccharide biosynthesis tyrosine autokinase [Mucilaginibacter flavidus]